MDALLVSPLGALLARPWVDGAGLFGLRRWYLPLSRHWAAANAGEAEAPALHTRARRAAEAARAAWETAIFAAAGPDDPLQLDRQRRRAATRHLATRALFYPRLFRDRSVARWTIDPPDRTAVPVAEAVAVDTSAIEVSRPFERAGLREYWLRAPTPSARLRARPGSATLYARVVEPAGDAARATLILGSGLCLEFELLTVARDPAARLAAMGWRVIEPIAPYHGLRAMPGYYGGEPFFALAPTTALDLIAGQAAEWALLTAWSRARFGSPVAMAGISMTSFVAQQAAGRSHLWPGEARPDAVMLISHSGDVEGVTFDGALAGMLGLDRALQSAGWTRAALARLAEAVDPAEVPALSPSRIVSVLGETDRWVPYGDGRALAERWGLPAANRFRYRLGHLGMPVQLMRDAAPFERLSRVLSGA